MAIFSTIFVTLLFLTTVTSTCPNGWTRHNDSCYLFSHDKEDWPGATVMCKLMGGDLVEIQTEAEAKYLSQQVKLYNESYWIALSDASEEGSWQWMISKDPVTYTNWAPGQPDNNVRNENCADIWPNGLWNDGQCFAPHHYICEIQDENVGIIG
ncbi:C-type lectin (CTL) or carbohydrate-recognition domain (CRD) [Mactra antiquata]